MKGADKETDQYKWVEATKTLTLKASGFPNGETTDFSDVNKRGWKDHISSAEHLVVEDGITHLGAYTFYNCSIAVDVQLPATLEEIGKGAFYKCYAIADIRFKGTPNQWANIDFQYEGTTSADRAHPFGSSNATDRNFYFYGKNTATTELYFTPGLNCIKSYAFYRANKITRICLPASVSEIQSNALNCNMQYFVTLRTDAITLGDINPLTFKTGSSSYSYLYLPNGADNSYKTNEWFYDGNKSTEKGASNIGYSSSDKGAITWESGKYVYPLSGSFDGTNVRWEIIPSTGTLRIYGHGNSISTLTDGSTSLPWYRFKHLIDQVKIEGDGGTINHIYNNIKFCYSLRGITINQSTVPDINSDGIYSTLMHNEEIRLLISPSILTNTTITNLTSESKPWKDMIIGLSDNVMLADNTDNRELLEAVQTHIELPFEVAFGRTLTNEQYNTFCSPIPMSAEQITAAFGGADIRTLVSSEYNAETKELTLNFSESSLTEIEAGKPYLIKPVNETENPHFANIAPEDIKTTPIDAATEFVDFKGVLAPTALTGGDKNTLFLGAGNELFWPEADGNLNGFRAYFEIKDASAQAAKRARISMGGKIATGIENPSPALPSREGVKILRDGKLYLMYKGQMYDVQGRRI